jgi:hypothetical protein
VYVAVISSLPSFTSESLHILRGFAGGTADESKNVSAAKKFWLQVFPGSITIDPTKA